MSLKKIKRTRKIRLRNQIIADLSVNYVERFALLNGYAVEVIEKDYGYDMTISTFNSKREFENGTIYIQLKATDRPQRLLKGCLSFSIDKRDLNLWYKEPYPVILILYDARTVRAYWSYLQQYFRNLINFDINTMKESFVVNVPLTNQVDRNAFRQFRKYKNNTIKELRKANVISYT